ncbi:MAG: YjbQ family protein [Candidatus Lokiarchaeota archaeon]|nr:YjbQ family protein [Candidatus Lokiarchaeota archaeon]
MEKLYCPNFSCIFGINYSNPYYLPNIDGQIWPIFDEISFPKPVQELLKLKIHGHPVFYRRKITYQQLELELESSTIHLPILQAIELNEKFGIPNDFTLQMGKVISSSKMLASIYPEKNGQNKLEAFYSKNKAKIVGIVVYPLYQAEYLRSDDFEEFIKWIKIQNLPLKIDFINLHLGILPLLDNGNIANSMAKITSSLDVTHPLIIASGNWNDLILNIDKYKFQSNVFLELNLRMLGGETPTTFFTRLFQIPGFIQNWWNRIILASGAPTLESSQLVRGWHEATEILNLKFKNLLRIWAFRNANRFFGIVSKKKPIENYITYKLDSEFDNSHQIHLGYDIKVQSFCITQLISIQDTIDHIMKEIKEQFPLMKSGFITIKSNHTTTSLVINENEMGNFLDLHYFFVQKSMEDSQYNLHTHAAEEFRADFNFPDHLLASTYGQRTIFYSIRDGRIERGSRENVFVIVTFGPRLVTIGLDIFIQKKDEKEKEKT